MKSFAAPVDPRRRTWQLFYNLTRSFCRPPPSHGKWLPLGYVLLCLLAFTLAYLSLNGAEMKRTQAIRSATLLYLEKDSGGRQLGEAAATQFHIHTINLSKPGASSAVERLTGSRSIVSPSLIIPQSGGPAETVSGFSAIQQVLAEVGGSVSPIKLGKRALWVMFGLILLGWAFRSEVERGAALLPILGIVAIAALWGRCLHCNTGGSTLSALTPVLGLFYLGAGFALYTAPWFSHKFFYRTFLFCSAIVAPSQAYLLTQEPKLCPSCLTITFVSAAYFFVTAQTLSQVHSRHFVLPKGFVNAIGLFLVLLYVRHCLVLGGYVQAGKSPVVQVPHIMGAPLSRFVSASIKPQAGMLYVMGEDSCSACRKAEADLNNAGIKRQEIPFCSLDSSEVCFDAKNLEFPMPLLLICDRQGRIIYQHEGWTDSPELLEILKEQIQTTLKRSLVNESHLSL